ncbi:MAG: hypothetical protein OSB10_06075, partial [Planctomycetota bacterium]|nr:hypothetical protein [Planctomycetota bacterium]
MRAHFDDSTFILHFDPACGSNPSEAVRNDDCGFVSGHFSESSKEIQLGTGIHVGSWFIKNQNGCGLGQRSRDRQALPFAAGEIVVAESPSQ